MKINPLKVLKLLLATFQSLKIEGSPINHNEIELKKHIKDILFNAMNDFNGTEMTVEYPLNIQELYKDVEAQIVEDDTLCTITNPLRSPTNECVQDNEDLSK